MRERKFWTYIMASNSGTLYTGITNNIDRRVFEHKNNLVEGFSANYGCHRLVHLETFDDVRKAIAREKMIKGWSRAKKIALIERTNPRWQDFAEHWGWELDFPKQKKSGDS